MMERNSTFELLRVVAITFVVAHHVLLFGADVCGYLTPFRADAAGIAGAALNSIVITGVSLFVMISGWFGINKTWRPMVRLVVECGLYGALALGICLVLYHYFPIPHTSGAWSWARLWASMKFTNWWFIVHYLLLVLCAPMLEKCLETISQRALEKIVLCMMVLNFVFGYWWGYVNSTGYNVVQFVLLYLIARYMRLFPQSVVNRMIARWAWLVVALCASLMTGIYMLDTTSWQPGHNPIVWNYNNPLIVLESAAIFSLFARMSVRSRIINNVAGWILGVYLIQSSPNLVYFRNALGRWLYGEFGYLGFVMTVLALLGICLVLSMLVKVPLKYLFKVCKL